MDTNQLTPKSPKYKAGTNYGFFGYQGACIDLAIQLDDAEAIREAHKRDWIDHKTDTTMSTPIRRLCKNRGKVECEKALAELGYPL